MSINTAAGCALMGKSIEDARALLEEITTNSYHQSIERATSKRTTEVYGVDAVDLLAS